MSDMTLMEWLKNHNYSCEEVTPYIRKAEDGTEYTSFECSCGSRFDLDAFNEARGTIVRLGTHTPAIEKKTIPLPKICYTIKDGKIALYKDGAFIRDDFKSIDDCLNFIGVDLGLSDDEFEWVNEIGLPLFPNGTPQAQDDNPCVLCYRMLSDVTSPDEDVIIKAGEEVLVSVRPECDELYWVETLDKRVMVLANMDEMVEA